MSRIAARVSLIATLLASTACTQPAAQIDLKGGTSYTRNSSGSYEASSSSSHSSSSYSNNYNNSAPVSNVPQATESNAKVDSIGVNDLAPPSKNDKGSANTPVAPVMHTAEVHKDVLKAPAAPKVVAQEVKPLTQGVNPWTKKSRAAEGVATQESFNLRPQGQAAAEEQLVSDIKAKTDKPVAPLDNIASKDMAVADKQMAKTAKPLLAKQESSGFIWPVAAKKVVSGFGPKGAGKANDGINIASAEGEPVWASSGGEVVYVGNELKGYGNMVLIKHANGKTTSYAHLSKMSVDKYDRVKQGDIIGYVGSTGNVKEPQLHFAIHDGKDPVDPQKYLSRNVAGL